MEKWTSQAYFSFHKITHMVHAHLSKELLQNKSEISVHSPQSETNPINIWRFFKELRGKKTVQLWEEHCLNGAKTDLPKLYWEYLTRVEKARSMQKDRDTKRTPAGVAGGRLVISCRSCSASSSVGLSRTGNKTKLGIQQGRDFQPLTMVKDWIFPVTQSIKVVICSVKRQQWENFPGYNLAY